MECKNYGWSQWDDWTAQMSSATLSTKTEQLRSIHYSTTRSTSVCTVDRRSQVCFREKPTLGNAWRAGMAISHAICRSLQSRNGVAEPVIGEHNPQDQFAPLQFREAQSWIESSWGIATFPALGLT